jgi:hypothetical protein
MRAIVILLLLVTLPAQADDWRARVDTRFLALATAQGDGTQRITDTGLIMGGEYMDRAGVALGFDASRMSAPGVEPLDYSTLYLSGRYHLYSDAMSGRVTVRLDGYQMTSRTPGATTGTGDAGLAVLSWQGYARRFGFEIGAGHSRYPQLEVEQWTPAVGFAPFSSADWITLRASGSRYSNPALVDGRAERHAGELRWTHTFPRGNAFALDEFWLDVKGGERLYYIDPDAAAVINRPDHLREAAAVGVEWSLGGPWRLLTAAGAERSGRSADDAVIGGFAFLDLICQW